MRYGSATSREHGNIYYEAMRGIRTRASDLVRVVRYPLHHRGTNDNIFTFFD